MNSVLKSALKDRLYSRTLSLISGKKQLTCCPHVHVCFGMSLSSVSPSGSGFDSTERNKILAVMEKFGVKNDNNINRIVNMPVQSGVSPDSWYDLFDCMLKKGCQPSLVVDMLMKYPRILKIPIDRVQSTWATWMECLNSSDSVRRLLSTHPMLLSLTNRDITSRYRQLKAVIGSNKFILNLLMKCPQIMFQSVRELTDVSDYLSTEMVVRNAAEYYKSAAMGCSLEEVKTRHVFLVRCGKYKTPNLKLSETLPTGNPSLSEIYDISDEEFSTKTAGVTLEEYVVFKELYRKEINENAELFTDASDDSDSD